MLGTEPEIKSEYVSAGLVNLAFNAILDHGDRSLQAHQAAECAAEQGKFWPMHDIFFEFESDLYGSDVRAVIKDLALKVDMDHDAFNTCVDEQRYVERVQAQDAQRRALGLRTRPSFDVNGQFLIGSQPFSVMQNTIETILAAQ